LRQGVNSLRLGGTVPQLMERPGKAPRTVTFGVEQLRIVPTEIWNAETWFDDLEQASVLRLDSNHPAISIAHGSKDKSGSILSVEGEITIDVHAIEKPGARTSINCHLCFSQAAEEPRRIMLFEHGEFVGTVSSTTRHATLNIPSSTDKSYPRRFTLLATQTRKSTLVPFSLVSCSLNAADNRLSRDADHSQPTVRLLENYFFGADQPEQPPAFALHGWEDHARFGIEMVGDVAHIWFTSDIMSGGIGGLCLRLKMKNAQRTEAIPPIRILLDGHHVCELAGLSDEIREIVQPLEPDGRLRCRRHVLTFERLAAPSAVDEMPQLVLRSLRLQRAENETAEIPMTIPQAAAAS
jgi:hypothetical protein